jgi:hypothetical protein
MRLILSYVIMMCALAFLLALPTAFLLNVCFAALSVSATVTWIAASAMLLVVSIIATLLWTPVILLAGAIPSAPAAHVKDVQDGE